MGGCQAAATAATVARAADDLAEVRDRTAIFQRNTDTTVTAVATVAAAEVQTAAIGVTTAAGPGIAAAYLATHLVGDGAAIDHGDPAAAVAADGTIADNAGSLTGINRATVTAIAADTAQDFSRIRD